MAQNWIGAKIDHKQEVFVLPSINNVSFAGSRKDIDLEIVWFFAYWAWKYDSWVSSELF